MSSNFWDYAIKYANLLYNITPHRGINNRIPNELYYQKKVDLKYIKVFGCIAHYPNYSQKKTKPENKTSKGVFVGFNIESNCYMIMDPKNYNIHLVSKAEFDEETPSQLSYRKFDDEQNQPTNIINNDNYHFEFPFIYTDEVTIDYSKIKYD